MIEFEISRQLNFLSTVSLHFFLLSTSSNFNFQKLKINSTSSLSRSVFFINFSAELSNSLELDGYAFTIPSQLCIDIQYEFTHNDSVSVFFWIDVNCPGVETQRYGWMLSVKSEKVWWGGPGRRSETNMQSFIIAGNFTLYIFTSHFENLLFPPNDSTYWNRLMLVSWNSLAYIRQLWKIFDSRFVCSLFFLYFVFVFQAALRESPAFNTFFTDDSRDQFVCFFSLAFRSNFFFSSSSHLTRMCLILPRGENDYVRKGQISGDETGSWRRLVEWLKKKSWINLSAISWCCWVLCVACCEQKNIAFASSKQYSKVKCNTARSICISSSC